MSEIALNVSNLSKCYRIGAARSRASLRETLTRALSAPFRKRVIQDTRTVWSLRDISFELNHGEVLGLIGRNGAGKSTLLKVLSRITMPTSGSATIYGRVGSLLEVGTGFHPELTARENIFLNGAVLGMRRADIQRHFDEIVDFSEVGKFLDTAVKHFSSGMYMRLAFAVAANLQADVLLVDEVLAVGDIAFQEKCLNKMQNVSRQGRTVIFVSHNMDSIRRLCTTAIQLHDGGIVAQGACHSVVDRYLSQFRKEQPSSSFDFEPKDQTKFFLERLEVLDLEGNSLENVRTWDAVRFRFVAWAPRAFNGAAFVIRIDSVSGASLFVTSSQPDHTASVVLRPGRNTFDCIVHKLMLSEGVYTLTAGLAVPNAEYLDEREVTLRVHAKDIYSSGLAPSSGRYFVPMETSWQPTDPQ